MTIGILYNYRDTVEWRNIKERYPKSISLHFSLNHICRRHKRCGFNPWVGKIPWRREQQSTPILLPGESHGQRSLVSYKERDTSKQLTHTYNRELKQECIQLLLFQSLRNNSLKKKKLRLTQMSIKLLNQKYIFSCRGVGHTQSYSVFSVASE